MIGVPDGERKAYRIMRRVRVECVHKITDTPLDGGAGPIGIALGPAEGTAPSARLTQDIVAMRNPGTDHAPSL